MPSPSLGRPMAPLCASKTSPERHLSLWQPQRAPGERRTTQRPRLGCSRTLMSGKRARGSPEWGPRCREHQGKLGVFVPWPGWRSHQATACLPAAPERERGIRSFLGWRLAGAHGPGEQKTSEKREKEKRVGNGQVRQGPCVQRAQAGAPPPAFLCSWSRGCSVPLKAMARVSVLSPLASCGFLGVFVWVRLRQL